MAAVVLVVFYYLLRADTIAALAGSRGSLTMTRGPVPPAAHFIGAAIVLAVVPVLIARFGLKLRFSELGLGLGRWRAGLVWLAIGIPLAVIAGMIGSGNPETRFVYPLDTTVGPELSVFIPYALLQFFYFGAWEVLFRGVLLFGLKDRIGAGPANALQTALSVIAHFGRPLTETLAAVPGGLIFGEPRLVHPNRLRRYPMSHWMALTRGRMARVGIALAVLVIVPRLVQAQTNSEQVFGESLGLKRRDIMALEGGRIVAKILKTSDVREVAVIGAVHVRVPLDILVEFYRDVESLMVEDQIVVQVGMFDAKPLVLDLHRLDLPEGDFEALRECRVGKCKFKLTRHQIELLRENVDWSHPDYERQATSVLVSTWVANLIRYMSEGNDALPVYQDKERPLDAAEDFSALLSGSTRFLIHDPGLYRYLHDFPDADVSDIEDFFYWTVEDFGLKPVTALNHMMISRSPSSGFPFTTIAIKQIYASHYLQSLIKLATLAPASERYPLRGTHLVLYARMRFDDRVGSIKRQLLERRLEHTWTMHLKTLRKRAEGKYQIRVAERED
jgi:membrane protease YdiL (CAAX protease family)